MDKLDELTIKRIEHALGFKLYDYQMDRLLNRESCFPYGRRTGKTLIFAIEQLFAEDKPMDLKRCNVNKLLTDRPSEGGYRYYLWYREFVQDLYYKFNDAGIVTRKVNF